VVAGALEHVDHVIVVDDGSVDGTASRVAGMRATLLRHAVQQGKGAALQTGIRHALDQGADWLLLMDGDLQHRPADIPIFLLAAEATRVGLVIGNRCLDRPAMPWVRRFINVLMSWLISAKVGVIIPDTQCGFKLVQATILRSLSPRYSRFEVDSELIVTAVECGADVGSVPIRAVYRGSPSRIRPAMDSIRWIRWFLTRRPRSQA
jgi:glycosyltransferase involved in cell wall biosynthesis